MTHDPMQAVNASIRQAVAETNAKNAKNLSRGSQEEPASREEYVRQLLIHELGLNPQGHGLTITYLADCLFSQYRNLERRLAGLGKDPRWVIPPCDMGHEETTVPLTVEQAKCLRVCRICEKNINEPSVYDKYPDQSLVFNFGKEHAHGACLKHDGRQQSARDSNAELAELVNISLAEPSPTERSGLVMPPCDMGHEEAATVEHEKLLNHYADKIRQLEQLLRDRDTRIKSYVDDLQHLAHVAQEAGMDTAFVTPHKQIVDWFAKRLADEKQREFACYLVSIIPPEGDDHGKQVSENPTDMPEVQGPVTSPVVVGCDSDVPEVQGRGAGAETASPTGTEENVPPLRKGDLTMATEAKAKHVFQVGDRVVKNPATWVLHTCPTIGEGVGMVIPADEVVLGYCRVLWYPREWPQVICWHKLSELLPAPVESEPAPTVVKDVGHPERKFVPWYHAAEAAVLIGSSPIGWQSEAFDSWFAKQLNLAFAKGEQIAEGAATIRQERDASIHELESTVSVLESERNDLQRQVKGVMEACERYWKLLNDALEGLNRLLGIPFEPGLAHLEPIIFRLTGLLSENTRLKAEAGTLRLRPGQTLLTNDGEPTKEIEEGRYYRMGYGLFPAQHSFQHDRLLQRVTRIDGPAEVPQESKKETYNVDPS